MRRRPLVRALLIALLGVAALPLPRAAAQCAM